MATEKLIATRDYKFSDGTLEQLADLVKANIIRDMAALAVRGVTAATATALQALIDTFKDAPTDEEAQGVVSQAVEIKNAARDGALLKARSLRSAAANVYGEDAAKYKRFHFEDMDKLRDNDLPRAMRKMARVGSVLQAELAGEGIDAAFITAFETAIETLDTELDNVDIAEQERDRMTEDRIEKGNTLYKEIVRLTNIGKDVFASVSEATYNDYVIENFTGSGSGNNGNTITVSGITIDDETGDPVGGVTIKIGNAITIVSNPDGTFSEEIEITAPTTFTVTISKPGYLTRIDEEELVPGEDRNENVPVEPTGYMFGTTTNFATTFPLANVIVTDVASGISTTSDANGNYILEGISEGNRDISYAYAGFQTTVINRNFVKRIPVEQNVSLQPNP